MSDEYRQDGRIAKKFYERELFRLQEELVDLHEWIKQEGLRVAVIFEGRDAAGKGGVIKRITQRLNPRIARVVALGIPTERERSQWYFPTLHPSPAGRRGDGAVRSQLVQPRRSREGDGVLHRR